MKLEIREVVGGSTEIVDVEQDGGEGQPLIVARTYEPEATALLLAGPDLLAACRGLLALAQLNGRMDGESWRASGRVLIHQEQMRDCGRAVLDARAAIAKAVGQ